MLQLALFPLPLALLAPMFLEPGILKILKAFAALDFSPYLTNLMDGAYGIFSALIPLAIGALVLGLLRMILHKLIREHCDTKTTALSVCIGGCGSAALFCAITFIVGLFTSTDLSNHPLQIAWGFVFGLLFSIAFMLLVAVYLFWRLEKRSIFAAVFDFATAIISAFSLFSMGSVALAFLSDVARLLEW